MLQATTLFGEEKNKRSLMLQVTIRQVNDERETGPFGILKSERGRTGRRRILIGSRKRKIAKNFSD